MSTKVIEDQSSEKKFVVRDIPNKGKGIVAIKAITEGELILAESPLFTVPWWVRTGHYPRFVPSKILTWMLYLVPHECLEKAKITRRTPSQVQNALEKKLFLKLQCCMTNDLLKSQLLAQNRPIHQPMFSSILTH